jgi:cell division protein FtsI/penicillin-binding protein 2
MNKIKLIKRKSPDYKKSEKNWRIYTLVSFVFLASVVIMGKLYVLQILRHSVYVALAENQHGSKVQLNATRGEIFLQDENEPYPVAVNKELQMVYAVPREMKDVSNVTSTLANILSLDKNFLDEKLNDPEDMFEIIKHKLSEEEAQKIRDSKIAGVYLTPENFRYYPAAELAAQTIGFVGSNGSEQKGMYGLEASWEQKLKGISGSRIQEGDSRGRWIPVSDRDVQVAQDGADIILTINHTVQFEVEKILKETMEKFSADSATAVVMDPKTGKILALANQPSFNPNDFSSTEDISRFGNPAVNEPYESGSVFKVFTEAIGIDDGKINPDTTYVDTGVVSEAGYEIHNSDMKANGLQTMTQVLEKSLNTGVIYIEKLVGNKNFAAYVERFGFGQKSGIDLPGEVSGNIKNLDNPKTTINFFTASFGQGISVTPIQLTTAYAALANKGTLMKPQIVDELRYFDGHSEKIEPKEVRQVVTENTAKLASDMLRSVVLNGHGKQADVPGYLVGGKTGTAQVAKSGSKGYEEGMNIGSFAGYAPINDAKFVLLVKIVNPKGVQWAESSAAPTFGRIMKFLLEYYKIKPTEDPTISPMYKKYQTDAKPLVDVVATPVVEKTDNKKSKDKSEEKNSKIIKSAD